MIIAYNLCYSTCMGRAPLDGRPLTCPRRLGCTQSHALVPGTLARLLAGGNTMVTPNGAIFCTSKHRPGVLPRLLREILETRVMVKVRERQQ